MPLLSIVGRTGMNSTFYLAFAFLSGEGKADFIWALEQLRNMLVQTPDVLVTDREVALAGAIEEIFPDCTHLLCMWHIEKNVLANCKKEFGTYEKWENFLESWTNVCSLKTIANYDAGWSTFKNKYAGKSDVVSYLEKTWIPDKAKFVRAWTDKVMHFQNTSTSAVEGAHSALKRYLQTSIGHLDLVQARMKKAIEHQARELEENIASERIRIPHVFHGSVSYEQLAGRVSVFALKQIEERFNRPEENLKNACSHTLRSTMGLPCVLEIRDLCNSPIPLTLIHQHWHLGDINYNAITEGAKQVSIMPNNIASFQLYLKALESRYLNCSPAQQSIIHAKISELVSGNFSVLAEPSVLEAKGRPLGAQNKVLNSSTSANRQHLSMQ